jgi:hypothetical protein
MDALSSAPGHDKKTYPYNTAHIVCRVGNQNQNHKARDRQDGTGRRRTKRKRKRTVLANPTPIALSRTAHASSALCAKTNMMQKAAVMRVLPARDQRRPRGVSMSFAPTW